MTPLPTCQNRHGRDGKRHDRRDGAGDAARKPAGEAEEDCAEQAADQQKDEEKHEGNRADEERPCAIYGFQSHQGAQRVLPFGCLPQRPCRHGDT